MKVLGIAGSNSSTSINRRLVKYVCNRYFSDESIEVLDLNDYEVEIFSVDTEDARGIPNLIFGFAKAISEADLLVVSLAENNGSYSAAFKNIYDWTSRIKDRKVFDNKPMLLMATSPGGRGGQSVLTAALDRFPRDGAEVLESFSLPNFNTNFEEGQAIKDNDLMAALNQAVEKVKEGLG